MGIRSWVADRLVERRMERQVRSIARRVVAFEAGREQRRLRGFAPSTSEINTQMRRYGKTVLARSRFLAVNNAYASNARQVYISALVGSGIKPSSLIPEAQLKATVAATWATWTDEADSAGVTSFYGLQALVAGELFEAGECFVRLRSRLPEDGLAVPLQLQLLPAEMLPSELNEDLGAQGSIESGIQFGPLGNRVAYHFLTRHPGADRVNFSDPRLYTVVPASEVLHLFRPIAAGQIRGLPHTLSAIVQAAILDAFDDAELERKRVASLFGAFITRPAIVDEEHPLEGGNLDAAEGEGDAGRGDWGLEPAAAIDLEPGEDVKFSEPADVGGSYEAFQYRNLLRQAAGYGVPYAAMTGDLRQTSYGSIRAGLVEFRRRIEQQQDNVLIYQFCRPVWRRWVEDAIVAGSLPIAASAFLAGKATYLAVKWMCPHWEWIDPLKDLQAEALAVNSGFKSRSDVIEAEGYDPEETDARIKADQERAQALDIKFDVGRSGTSQIAIGEGSTQPDPNLPQNPPVNDPPTNSSPVSINIPTPWPHGEVIEVLEHDTLGQVLKFVKRPAAVGE